MSEEVAAALERFQNFTGRFSVDDWVIDEQSGFTFGDAMVLVAEVETSGNQEDFIESAID